MTTKREEIERLFLAAVIDATEVIEDHGDHTIGQWSPRRACEALAHEVAAALGEMQAKQHATGPSRYEPAVFVGLDDCVRATPPAPEPAVEAMTGLRAELLCKGVDVDNGAEGVEDILEAARADQRAAVEAACEPLRERVRELERSLKEYEEAVINRLHWKMQDTLAVVKRDEAQLQRIAALEAELAEALGANFRRCQVIEADFEKGTATFGLPKNHGIGACIDVAVYQTGDGRLSLTEPAGGEQGGRPTGKGCAK